MMAVYLYGFRVPAGRFRAALTLVPSTTWRPRSWDFADDCEKVNPDRGTQAEGLRSGNGTRLVVGAIPQLHGIGARRAAVPMRLIVGLGIAECAAALKYPEFRRASLRPTPRPGILFWKKSDSLECFLYNSPRRQLFLASCG